MSFPNAMKMGNAHELIDTLMQAKHDALDSHDAKCNVTTGDKTELLTVAEIDAKIDAAYVELKAAAGNPET